MKSRPTIGASVLGLAVVSGAAWLAWGGVGQIKHSINHHGGGTIYFEDSSRRVGEAEYKRHYMTNGILMVVCSAGAVGFYIWYLTNKRKSRRRMEALIEEESERLGRITA